MSNELLNALENRVSSAIETIEGLRAELRDLKQERQVLEDKLRELLSRMDVAGPEDAPAGTGQSAADNVEHLHRRQGETIHDSAAEQQAPGQGSAEHQQASGDSGYSGGNSFGFGHYRSDY